MNSSDKSATIILSLGIISVLLILSLLIYTNYMETLEYIKAGYQECYIIGHGTEWMKDCIPQVKEYVEKR